MKRSSGRAHYLVERYEGDMLRTAQLEWTDLPVLIAGEDDDPLGLEEIFGDRELVLRLEDLAEED